MNKFTKTINLFVFTACLVSTTTFANEIKCPSVADVRAYASYVKNPLHFPPDTWTMSARDLPEVLDANGIYWAELFLDPVKANSESQAIYLAQQSILNLTYGDEYASHDRDGYYCDYKPGHVVLWGVKVR